MSNNNINNNHFNINNPFKTGTDYFESFNSKLQNRIDDFEEIKTLAPLLSNIPKYNPFETPANYFDELPTIVQQRSIENRPFSSFIEWLKLLIQPRFAIPVFTTLMIAFAGINYMDKNFSKPSMVEALNVEEQLYNIDESTIIESLITDAGSENKVVSNEDNSIENYLIDNRIDEKQFE